MYDPRGCGALCDQCPLNGVSVVVPPEDNYGAQVAIVGDYPADGEDREGRPFVGAPGREMDVAIRLSGWKRRDIHWTNAVLCRPPDGDMEKVIRAGRKENKEIRKQNTQRKKTGEDLLPEVKTPFACCHPRLRSELFPFRDVVVAGTLAAKAVVGPSVTIMSIRGGMIELDPTPDSPARRVMGTVHPSFVMHQRRWTDVFRNDINRASRWFKGVMNWSPPAIFYHPPAEALDAFLKRNDVSFWTYDVETDAIECLTANVRCLAIGTPDEVAVIGVLGINGEDLFYTPPMQEKVKAVLCDFFTDETRIKVGHNAGYYDRIVMQKQFGITPEPLIDTMMLHRLVASELPHSLGFVGSFYTDAPSWKTDREGRKLAYGSESDEELHEYCGMDVAVTARVLSPLMDRVALRRQMPIYAMDQKMQTICAEMHTVGMYADQKRRQEWERELLHTVYTQRDALRGMAVAPNMNPNSVYQIRGILFDKWQLDVPLDDKERLTKSGDPSTSDDVLRALMTVRSLTGDQREFIKRLRKYRKAMKMLGTYVVKLRYEWEVADLGWDDEDAWMDKEAREKYGLEKKGIVNPFTGRFHPGYNAHVTVTGRLSSSKPINAQNFPKGLRDMVIAAPGNTLVGADADQLELRIAAAHWGAQMYLDAFKEGRDPHSMTAEAIFGDRFMKAEGRTYDERGQFTGEGPARALRDLAKRVQYASQYMATVETVHRVITQTEIFDKKTGESELPYLNLSMREVRKMHERWLESVPEFEKGWEREIGEWRAQGFLAEPITGRRRDFLDGENPNELVNFKIQASAAALMNIAALKLVETIPTEKWGEGTGLINQCHDSLVVECPEKAAGWVSNVLEECMNQEHEGIPNVRFTASAETGQTWKQVG